MEQCTNIIAPSVWAWIDFLYRWRRLRKAAHLGLHLRAAEAYYPIEEREAAILVQDLLRDPGSW